MNNQKYLKEAWNHEIRESGLGAVYKISPVTSNLKLSGYLGKAVRYTESALSRPNTFGTVHRDCTFLIKETQINFNGDDCLRGYAVEIDDTFGHCISPSDVEIV